MINVIHGRLISLQEENRLLFVIGHTRQTVDLITRYLSDETTTAERKKLADLLGWMPSRLSLRDVEDLAELVRGGLMVIADAKATLARGGIHLD